jgi:hypothetical protein
MTAGLCTRATSRLQNAKLRLKLRYMALKGIERASDLVGFIAVIGERDVLDARKGRQRRRLCSTWILGRHGSLSPRSRVITSQKFGYG